MKRVPMPAKRQREAKPETRWKSPAHLKHVRDHGCSWNGCDGVPIEAAHVRLGSGAGIGCKPDDWRAVSLCMFHHTQQHRVGERTFWSGYDIEGLIEDFIRSSPRRAEIERARSAKRLWDESEAMRDGT